MQYSNLEGVEPLHNDRHLVLERMKDSRMHHLLDFPEKEIECNQASGCDVSVARDIY